MSKARNFVKKILGVFRGKVGGIKKAGLNPAFLRII
jgi:hypothetical protein